jgi:hypothetical protein
MPDDHSQFARCGNSSDLQAATCTDSLEKSAQRSRRFRRCPGGLDQHRPRVRASAFADMPMLSRLQAGLIHTRVQPEIAHELLGRAKARDIADCSQQPDGHRCVHPCDRQKLVDARIFKHRFAEQAINGGEILTQAIQLAQPLLHAQALIHWQRLFSEPSASLSAEQIGRGTPGPQVRSQHRVNLVLQPHALAHDLGAARHLATKRERVLVGNPHLGQEPAGIKLGQNSSVDLVGLDLGPGDEAHLQRIGYDDPSHVGFQRCHNRGSIARGFKNYFVGATKPLGKRLQRRMHKFHASARLNSPALEISYLGNGARNIQSYYSHLQTPSQQL